MNWDNITIGQFYRILEISKLMASNKDEDKHISFVVKLLSVVSNKTEKEILSMPIDEFNKATKELSFINEQPKGRISDTITVDGIKYSIPVNIFGITTSQYIDYTETLRNDPQNIAMMCAIFCVPEGKKYNEGYNVLDLAETFTDKFLICDAIGISFFFTEFLRTSVKSTLSYLESSLKKEMKKKKNRNKQRMEAIQMSIQALKNVGGVLSC